MERSGASNTFTAHSEPYNRGTIHAWRCASPAISASRDDLRTRSRAAGFRRGSGLEGRERRENGADERQRKLRSLCGKAGGAQSLRDRAALTAFTIPVYQLLTRRLISTKKRTASGRRARIPNPQRSCGNLDQVATAEQWLHLFKRDVEDDERGFGIGISGSIARIRRSDNRRRSNRLPLFEPRICDQLQRVVI